MSTKTFTLLPKRKKKKRFILIVIFIKEIVIACTGKEKRDVFYTFELIPVH